MKKTWDQYAVKKENKSLILDTIKKSYPISRADIANITGLNKGTVSSLVNELLEEELVYESGPGESSGGRRPVMLLFNKLAGYSIGIDLGVNYILGVLTDIQGNIYHEEIINFHNTEYEIVRQKLCSIIDKLKKKAPSSPYGIIGIGLGVPGIVTNDGKILLAPNLDWKHIDLRAFLEEKYNVPVTIENEANTGAYGEKKFGIGKNYENIVYVSVGIGIGVGLILNGDLYKGNNGFSGEIGHMSINSNGEICRCGNVGCWELYASEQALLKNTIEQDIQPLEKEKITLENLIDLAERGNNESIKLFEQIGDYLGIGVINIMNTFNPQQIIIGNRMSSARNWLITSLNKRIINHSMEFNQKDLDINFSKLTTHSSALGAAAFSIESFFGSQILINTI